ncbi:DUF1615 domain-containing protein [Pseudomonas plecoglossicida]|uniref:DUF1615 domain-containing protein n=1 Tax=Pseudomonas plecoglossicida TaxID=70775 RepID=A0AAD0QTB2_PSEDL|nr:DUF1615 domain-containing protein [Pseudomonas plecoglossicida]AXM95195.1 DUF1615 domain-containing protein [Pseudomonas plecoglossicida]EPB97915.1 hypothetical protein L321_00637 [Pseudomonas plecoglossicida NB2011]QLB55944.1 DUF1615 domain-containing protein [Pseudomonas plecoglossicida]GLR35454.1 hypothetical protein GCM10011247_08510 [Pseudomonas plecoglossicida]
MALALLQGCVGRREEEPEADPAKVRAQLLRLLPAQAKDREGWAKDIQQAFEAQRIAPSKSNLCAVLAVTEQESTFSADPQVPNLGRIAREEIDRRAARMHVPRLLVDGALNTTSGNGKTYQQRLLAVRSEKELSALFDEFIARLPLGKSLLGGLNPVHTGGPMQVSIEFAEQHAKDYPYAYDGTIRQEVFTRRGGMYFGIAHLLGYPANYERQLYRFADFNAGWYASRNAAFQAALSKATGTRLALDGDLIAPGSIMPGSTEQAARKLGVKLGLRNTQIRSQLEKGDRLAFEDSKLYSGVFALADAAAGKPVPRAVLPGIELKSPKITRKLTTAWFAGRVDERYQRCMKR